MQNEVYRTRPFRSPAWGSRTDLFAIKTLLLLLSICLGSLTHTVLAQDWAQRGSDITGVASEGVGVSVSLSADGTIVAIGANANDVNPANSKTSVKVREWNGSTWVQKGSTLYAEQSGDNFGFSVSLSADGTVLAVGAHTFSDIPLFGEFSFSGKVYVYDWSGTDWVLRGTALMGGAAGENFGNSVSLSQDGNLIAVGAPGANAGGTLRGITRVYEWSGTSWGQVGSNIIGGTDFENLGTSVSLKVTGTESVLAVGAPTYAPAPGSDNTGLVKIYRDTEGSWGGSWSSPEILNGSNTGDYFGHSVSLSDDGNRLAVGAPTDGIFTTAAIGYARVFDYAAGSFAQAGSDLVSNLVYDTYGERLALSGDGQYLIIGAKGGTGNEKGRAEIYEFSGSSWQQVGSDIIGEDENEFFGQAVAINDDGSMIAIGGSVNSSGAGHVQLFIPGCTPPSSPTGTATQEFCSGATVAQLSATGTGIQWYDAASGGTLLNSTTALTNSTIYYATQTVSACESTDRLAVTVTVNTTAAPTGEATQSFCAAATVAELTATGTDIKWYDAATNGNLLDGTTALVSGTSYYASQTVGGCESTTRFAVEVTINTVNAPTALSTQSFCNEGTVADLEANGTDIKWYDAESAGSLLDGSIVLVHGTTYYASQTVDGCESTSRLAVTADVFVMPVPTGETSQIFCEGATVAALAATGIEGPSIKWYSEAAGGSVVDNATALVDGTTYYAVLAFGACESASRLAVTAAVNTTPTAPTGDAAQAFCNSATLADLVAIGTDIKWYDAETAGNLLESTDALVSGTTYYASQTVSGCESARLEVTATVTIAAAPTGESAQLFCNDATVADITATGTDIKWYDVATGGTPLSGTQQLQTDVELAFYASQTVNGCESTERLSVAAGVYFIVAPTGNATQVFCGAATIADLEATPMESAEITWYADATGGTALEGSTALVNGTKYYAEQLFSTFCPSVSRLEVTVELLAVPTTPVSEVTQPTCSLATGTITITAQHEGEVYSFNNGVDYQSANSLSALTAGDYQVVIKNADGCLSPAATVTVNTQPPPPGTPVATVTHPTCEVRTGTITVTIQQAGDTYSFNNGTEYQSSNIKSGLEAGEYQIIIKNEDGCTSVVTTSTVNAPPAIPTAPTGNATQSFCGAATVAQLTATGTSIKWYAAETGGTPLATTTALTANTTYYASQTVDCESTSRLAVTVTLVKCDQTITFDELPVKTFGDDPITLEATTTSLLAITYTSSNTNVATIDGDQLTIVGAGTTTITASQAGDANYNAAAAVERSLTVNKASQSISGFDLPETYDLANGNTLTLSATAPSGQVTFSSSNTSVATVDGNTLNLVAPGSVTITALATTTNNYLEASASATIDVTDSRAILEIGEIGFGLLLRGETLTLAITVTNKGPATATITNVTVPAGFAVTPTSFTLADEGTRVLSITFAPTEIKDYSGILTLTTTALNNTKPIIAECVHITELEQGADSNTIAYPNPGNGIYTISNAYEKQVTIIAPTGNVYHREASEVAPRLMSLDMTDLPNGLYVLHLRSKGKTTVVKVIKQ